MKDWIKAARLVILPLSISGIITGFHRKMETFTKWRNLGFTIFALALLQLCYQGFIQILR